MLPVLTVRTTELPSGEAVPVLGQGTWGLGESVHPRKQEIEALQVGIDLGMTLVDTAEMYASGEAEKVVGEAIAGRRGEVFITSKVLPQHASKHGVRVACERSLNRLRTDRLDLYLLHWRGTIPLQETLDGFAALVEAGKIRYWGVSNFDIADMQELDELIGGADVATDQVLYNLTRRGIEFNLLPWCRKRGIPVMAYSPIEQGRMLRSPDLQKIAARHQATPAQIALAWLLRLEKVIAIPRAGTPTHVRENRAALDLKLTSHDLEALDRAFPPPAEARPLEML
jgi:diketogulonate reductase-like aldo/keto reductase